MQRSLFDGVETRVFVRLGVDGELTVEEKDFLACGELLRFEAALNQMTRPEDSQFEPTQSVRPARRGKESRARTR